MASIVKLMSELIGEPLFNESTVHDILTTAAEANSSSIAVAALHQSPTYLSSLSGNATPSSTYLRWTFNELLHASHKVAVALAASGIQPGQIIAAYVACGVEFHILVRAALELNCPFAPLDPRSAANGKETNHFFEILEPEVVVVLDEITAEHLTRSVPDKLERARVLLVCGKGQPLEGKWQDLSEFVEGAEKGFELGKIERKMDDVALVVFTSGTTSLSKGVPHTNRSCRSSSHSHFCKRGSS